MAAFSGQQRERFEDEVAVYISREYPEQAAELGDDGLHDLVRDGVDKASAYNILLERDVARYIEFMVILGADFDESDETPWARGILKRRSATAASKLDEIWHRAADYEREDEAALIEEDD